jgi:hypothetical protein
MRAELSAAIGRRFTERLRPTDGDEFGLERAADELGALPLVDTWGARYAIDPAGRVWCIFWAEEGTVPRRPEVVTDARSWVWALCEGTRKYPELQQLLPTRPFGVPDCPDCNGVGIWSEFQQLGAHPPGKLSGSLRRLAEGDPVLCSRCGGLGWVYSGPVPDEATSPTGGPS